MTNEKNNYDEIDIIDILETIWDSKFTILGITFVSFFLSFIWVQNKTKSFSISFPIEQGDSSTFIDLQKINEILYINGLIKEEKQLNDLGSEIFLDFIEEFKDYEEVIKSLDKNDNFYQTIKESKRADINQELFDYVNSFKISETSQGKINKKLAASISFNWNNVDEGKNLLNNAILLTLENVKLNYYNNLYKIVSSTDLKNKFALENLRNKLKVLLKHNEIVDSIRLQFLEEQSEIAKSLNIKASENKDYNFDPSESLFFLRGYESIEKEISIIKKRTNKEKLLSLNEYNELSKKILLLEDSSLSSNLVNLINDFDKNETNDWIKFDLRFANISSENNNILYVIFIFFGVFLGLIYSIISKNIIKRKADKSKV